MADIDRVLALADPIERARELGKVLNALPDLTATLRSERQRAVLEIRALGKEWSYARIGEELDLHRNRVQQIAEGRSAGGQGGARAAADGH